MLKRSASQVIPSCSAALETLLRAVLYPCSQAVLIVDDERKCVDASFGACSVAGRPRDALIGIPLDEVLEPAAGPELERLWPVFLAQGTQEGFFKMAEVNGGSPAASYIFRRNVLPGRHLAVFQDHPKLLETEQARSDVPLQEEVRDFALCLLDADGRVAAWYEGAERVYGYSGDEAVGQPLSFLDRDGQTQSGKLHPDLARAARLGRYGSEGWRERKDGSRFWANVLTSAVVGEDGKLLGFARVARNFTDFHETAEDLERDGGEPRRPRSSSSAATGIVASEFDRITDASDAFLAMLGYDLDELLAGRPYWPDITPLEYWRHNERAHEEALLYGACTPFEKELIRKDGSRVCVLATEAVISLFPFRWIILVQDLTSRKSKAPASAPAPHHTFDEIVGESPAMRRVLGQTEIVAPTEATVLILGETGTGKELIARAIHKLSLRSGPFVTLNCAAIPTGLLESELFGYEKGAFTGALTRKIGRFEIATGGTLFLDEVGDIPLELQPKLLRALQEKEFERLGGTRTIPIDVRLLAATNRDLTGMMDDKLFRSDLYYRLRVFPVKIPPLREHPEDIPALARYFMEKYAGRMKRDIQTIPPATLRAMVKWHWPGNVRELENFVERSVILSQGPTLHAPVAEIQTDSPLLTSSVTLDDVERKHIIRVLGETDGVVSRAAKRLDVPRTTLNAMMKRLGITRKDF